MVRIYSVYVKHGVMASRGSNTRCGCRRARTSNRAMPGWSAPNTGCTFVLHHTFNVGGTALTLRSFSPYHLPPVVCVRVPRSTHGSPLELEGLFEAEPSLGRDSHLPGHLLF